MENDKNEKEMNSTTSYPVQISEPIKTQGPFDPKFFEAQKKKREAEAELPERDKELEDLNKNEIPRHERDAGTTGPKALGKHTRTRFILRIGVAIMGTGASILAYIALAPSFYGREWLAGIGASMFGVGGYFGMDTFLSFPRKAPFPPAIPNLH